MNYKRKRAVIFFLAVLMIFSGCSAGYRADTQQKDSESNQENNQSSSSGSDQNNEDAEESGFENGNINDAGADTELNEEEMFSDRDKEAGYEESTSVHVILKDDMSESRSSLVSISENTVIIRGEGTFLLSGKLSNGQVIVDADKKDKIQIVFCGVDINCDTSAALYIRQADKVFVTLEKDTQNTLSNQKEFVAIDENNIDSVIFAKDDLTFNGFGTLKINAAVGHGIVSKDDLVFTDGIYQITAASHAISGKQSVRIADGSFQLNSGKDSIHAEDKDDDSLGFVYIAGGEFEITSDDDGIHAANITAIRGGNIDIINSYEGIEGQKVDISGGTITLRASDDGVNAAGGNDGSGFGGRGGDRFASDENSYIKISGGTITVNAEGDGIDSNGNLYISGGIVYVSGPTNSGNGAIDYNGEAEITGGIFVAVSAGGMEQNFGSSSTQCSILVNSSARQTGAVILKDSDGNEILSYIPEKSYSSAIISIPEISQKATYQVVLGEESVSVEITDKIYGSGSSMGAGHGGMGGHGGMKERGGNPPDGKPDIA